MGPVDRKATVVAGDQRFTAAMPKRKLPPDKRQSVVKCCAPSDRAGHRRPGRQRVEARPPRGAPQPLPALAAACTTVTRKVLSRVDGESREVRGLRRCESNACRSVPIKSRDYNAACNIACCVPPFGRPLYLQRSGDIVNSWRPDGLQSPYS